MTMHFDSTPVGTVDELEVDHIPNTGSGDDGTYGGMETDDATEYSMQPYLELNSALSSHGGSIRMEGWLNHTSSSHTHAPAEGGGNSGNNVNNSSSAASVAPSTTSMLSKKVSKKKRQATSKSKKTKQPRYFVLRGNTLSYYARQHDVKAKGTFVLTRGCTVGPVMYGSLDEPLSKATVVNAEEHQDQTETGEFPLSPSSSQAGHTIPPTSTGAASVSASTVTEHHHNKSKKKKRHFYLVQVSWPINDKPSKDEQIVAQAKAQVAAESENEALHQKQAEMLQELDDSFDDVTSTVVHNKGDRSPTGGNVSMRPKLGFRSKSENGMPSPRRRTTVDRATVDLPLNLHPPDLNNNESDNENSGHDHQQLRLIPAKIAPMSTPASTMAGMNAFHPTVSENDTHNENNPNDRGSLNHETGLHKHYTQQIEKHAKDQKKTEQELQKVMQLLTKKASHQRTKKKVIQGTKVAAVSTAALTAGVLTAGIGLAAGLVFVGITAAAGGSGAMVGSKVLDKARGKYHKNQLQKSLYLIIGASTYEEALRWKMAMECVIHELVEESKEEEDEQLGIDFVERDGNKVKHEQQVQVQLEINTAMTDAPSSPIKASTRNVIPRAGTTPTNGVVNISTNTNHTAQNDNAYHHVTPKWVPIQGGGMALWGILGALGGGGGNLRIYREELCPHLHSGYSLFNEPPTRAFPTMPRFRPNVGLADQPFPPIKASVALKANSLDAFMCLMCSGRIHDNNNIDGIPVPNSGQIASFRIIETMDDHMDVIHLVFRPLYLFPSWTAPRDFVLYRFWKYDDDGTYHICFDSEQHRDCPPVTGYVRGEMHGVYTIAPLKRKKKKAAAGAGAPGAAKAGSSTPHTTRTPNLMNEECLLSHVVQIDPRGWVPTTSSVPFLRNQGYGDAFAIMALHQMLDVKEALDSMRFVAVPMDGTQVVAAHDNSQGRISVKSQRRLRGPHMARPSRVGRDTSTGSARGIGGGRNGHQQLYVPTLETSGSVSEEEEGADYDFNYSGNELFSADGYHQSPSHSSSANRSVRTGSTNIDGTMRIKGSNKDKLVSSMSTIPPPMRPDWWAEPDANSFRVRGKNYKVDGKKVNAGSSIFRLITAEIIETDTPIMTGMCLHPKERFQLAMQRDREATAKGIPSNEVPPYVFLVNIILPGPPNYHILFYYAVDDMSKIDGSDGTPSSKLCNEFFFEKDDAFRDNTFKLIPQIIEGNFMVRKAVGATPAIMGNKIKQSYLQGENFFELMIDTGSSAVAAGVIRICNGYAKMIVVDLAFLFEGHSEQTLPERVLGCARLKNAEFGKKLRFVESADEDI